MKLTGEIQIGAMKGLDEWASPIRKNPPAPAAAPKFDPRKPMTALSTRLLAVGIGWPADDR